jgi:glucose/arabinose dehydrogenase
MSGRLSTQRAVLLCGILLLALAIPAAPALGATLPTGFSDALILASPTIAYPTAIAFTPDNRMLVSIHSGSLRVFNVSQNYQALGEALNLSSKLCGNSERGLLGIAVDPNFTSNKYIYLYYTFKKDSTCPEGVYNPLTTKYPVNRLSRFTLDSGGANRIDPATEKILLDNIPSVFGNHNSGDVHFGPDGHLYVSVGDGGCDYNNDSGCAETNNASRDPHSLNGKILRITRDGGVPPDNPWQGTGTVACALIGKTSPGNKCRETYVSGLRNAFRIAFKPGTSELYMNDVGQRTWEEINVAVKGADYGWNLRDGFCQTAYNSLGDCRTQPGATVNGLTDPLYAYLHPNITAPSGYNGPIGKSITGAAFVPGEAGWPTAYQGDYLFGDYAGWIYRLEPNGSGGSSVAPFLIDAGPVVELQFGPTPDGRTALYYTTYANKGEVRRIIYTGQVSNRAPLAALSASPTFGAAPLAVTLDGSASSDLDVGDTLSYRWDFGDGSPARTTSAPTTVYTYSANGVYSPTLTVTDQKGAASTPARVTIRVGAVGPTPTILAPAAGARYTVGEYIDLAGAASDPQDGQLPGNSLTWEVVLHHDGHTHPWLQPISGTTATTQGPPPEDLLAATNSYLEIILTATDSDGLTSVVTRELRPELAGISFASQPSSARLTINGAQITTPYLLTSVPGHELNVSAPAQTNASGQTLSFASWSDGGAATHKIVTPNGSAAYTATFDVGPMPIGPSVSGLTLIDADSDQPIAGYDPIPNGATLNLATLPSRRLNVRANVAGSVASVRFGLDANAYYHLENSAPFALAGNSGDNYAPWTPALGSHILTGTAFSAINAGGTASQPLALSFTVVDTSGAASPTPSRTATATATSGAASPTPSHTATATATSGAASPTPSHTATATATPTAVSGGTTSYSYTAVADTFVDSAQPNSSFGSWNQLLVVGSSGGSTKQSFLRFNVSGLPSGARVQAARLRLTVINDSNSGGNVYTLANNSWSESLTWNGRPAVSGSPRVTLGSVALNQVVEIDLAGFVVGNGSYSIAILHPSGNGNHLGYASRQAANTSTRPQLVLSVAGP